MPFTEQDHTGQIRCAHCHAWKPLEEFHVCNSAETNYFRQDYCIPCKAKYMKKMAKIDKAFMERELATEAREAREVLILMHERGRHDPERNTLCPICRAEADWITPPLPVPS